MANEIAYNVSLSFSKNGVAESVSKSGNVDVSGTRFIHNVQAVGTSAEALDLGDVTAGYVFVKNLNATNYVEVGVDGTNFVIKLKAGEFAIFRVDGATVQAKANTAACDVEYFIIDA